MGSILLFLGLGALAPRVQPAVSARDSLTDVATGGLLYLVRLLIMAAVGWVLTVLPGGWIPLEALAHPALQLLVVFLMLDFARYWMHRASHRVGFLWTFHRTHHSGELITSTTGLRMHVVDIFLLTMIPVVLFQFLFDISSFGEWVLPVALMIGGFFDAFEHANLRVNSQTPWFKAWNTVFNNPHFHAWHHTRDGHIKDGNYGQALTIWDRLFGSDVTEDEPPERYGLGHQWLELTVLGLQLLRPREVPPDHSPYEKH